MVTILQRYGFLDSQTLTEDLKPYAATLIDAQVTKLTTIIDSLVESKAKAIDSRSLTGHGKSEAIANAGRRAYADIKAMETSQKIEADLKKALRAIPSGRVPLPVIPSECTFTQTAAALWADRMRGEILTGETIEVRAMLERAAKAGDTVTIHALELIPKWKREDIGIHASDLEEIRQLYWAAAKPKELALIETIKSAQRTYRSNIQSARKDVEARANLPFVNPGV